MSDPHSESDNQILSDSVQNPAIFAVLVDRYQAEFSRKIRYILKNEDDTQDIVQDAFVKIYVHAGKYKARQDASCRAWMYKILLNTCYSHCRRKKKEQLFLNFTDQADMDLIEAVEDRERMLDFDRILIALTKIPISFSKLISEALINGRTYKDIARTEGISAGAVRTKIHRAKKELIKTLNAYGD